MNDALIKLASSSGELGITIGIMGIVFPLLYGNRICFSRSAAVKEEVKREAVMKGMIAIMFSAFRFELGISGIYCRENPEHNYGILNLFDTNASFGFRLNNHM